jgi:hypothetical protein
MSLISCPDCRKRVSDRAVNCIHCGCPLHSETKRDGGKGVSVAESGGHGAGGLGWLLLLGGVAGAVFALMMTVSVGTEYGPDVVNIGLMDDRRNYLIVSGLACVIGVILVATARPATAQSKGDTESDQLQKEVELENDLVADDLIADDPEKQSEFDQVKRQVEELGWRPELRDK